jgi:hypothetical protein
MPKKNPVLRQLFRSFMDGVNDCPVTKSAHAPQIVGESLFEKDLGKARKRRSVV